MIAPLFPFILSSTNKLGQGGGGKAYALNTGPATGLRDFPGILWYVGRSVKSDLKQTIFCLKIILHSRIPSAIHAEE
jgi:hypothetical protein